jgi:hypothetical protein
VVGRGPFELLQDGVGSALVALARLGQRLLHAQQRIGICALHGGSQRVTGARDITQRQPCDRLHEPQRDRRWPERQPFFGNAVTFANGSGR